MSSVYLILHDPHDLLTWRWDPVGAGCAQDHHIVHRISVHDVSDCPIL